MVKLQIKKVREDAIMPTQAHSGDMVDVYAAEDTVVNSFESTIIPLGIAMNIPDGYRVKVFSRSSLSLKKKLIVSNSVGIIDTGYKGEIGLICHSLPKEELIIKEPYFVNIKKYNKVVKVIDYENSKKEIKLINNEIMVNKGDKIAQFQLEKIEDFELEEVEELDMSNDRGGGYGSTGN